MPLILSVPVDHNVSRMDIRDLGKSGRVGCVQFYIDKHGHDKIYKILADFHQRSASDEAQAKLASESKKRYVHRS